MALPPVSPDLGTLWKHPDYPNDVLLLCLHNESYRLVNLVTGCARLGVWFAVEPATRGCTRYEGPPIRIGP